MGKASFRSHRADRPVRGIGRRRPQRALDHGRNLIVVDGSRPARAGLFGKLSNVTTIASLCCCALTATLLSTVPRAAADDNHSSWNKSTALKRAGYVELIGEDAAQLLVGNSVLVKDSGPLNGEKDGIRIQAKIYYFLNDHTLYKCGIAKESDCVVQSWGLQDNQVCLEVGSCSEPPKILKSPRVERHSTRLGIYLWFDHFAYDILKGNRTSGPLFDSRVSGRQIELGRGELENDVKGTNGYSEGDKQVSISGQPAFALLVGNTFLSDDAAKISRDQPANACPAQGTYYSPEGRVIRFTCHAGPSNQIWSVAISHWKLEGDRFCRDGPMDLGSFACKRPTVTAIAAPQALAASNSFLVQDIESGNALTGYFGNVLNFRFEKRLKEH